MSVSIYKIKKWAKMLSGKSSMHVNQDEGKCYSREKILGYYNNLTEKISRFGNGEIIPKSVVDTGEEVYFSIAIFQYGLAAYDLYLLNEDDSMLEIVKGCADWAIENQQEDGRWVTFAFEDMSSPYSSMAQGEAMSLLIRAYRQFGKSEYKDAAKQAMAFMLIPIEEGGTAMYDGSDLYLYEYTAQPCILNGWIFSAWGLFDYAKAFNDEQAFEKWNHTVRTMAKSLPRFDNGYWSKYNMDKVITSPFYHKLHIAQLHVMYDLTGVDAFKKYAEQFSKYQDSAFCRSRAFLYKVWQKIVE